EIESIHRSRSLRNLRTIVSRTMRRQDLAARYASAGMSSRTKKTAGNPKVTGRRDAELLAGRPLCRLYAGYASINSRRRQFVRRGAPIACRIGVGVHVGGDV